MPECAAKKTELHFKTMIQSDVPQGRHRKHRSIVTTILNDLDQLKDGGALFDGTRKNLDAISKVLPPRRAESGKVKRTLGDYRRWGQVEKMRFAQKWTHPRKLTRQKRSQG